MSDTAPDLPRDIDALRALVLEQRAELALAHSGLVEQRYEIEALKARLARLLRTAFGQSSEKLRSNIEELELLLADREEQAAETDTTIEAPTEAWNAGPGAIPEANPFQPELADIAAAVARVTRPAVRRDGEAASAPDAGEVAELLERIVAMLNVVAEVFKADLDGTGPAGNVRVVREELTLKPPEPEPRAPSRTAAGPVQHHHEVDKAAGHRNIRDVRGPDLVRPGHRHVTQPVRVEPVPQRWLAPPLTSEIRETEK